MDIQKIYEDAGKFTWLVEVKYSRNVIEWGCGFSLPDNIIVGSSRMIKESVPDLDNNVTIRGVRLDSSGCFYDLKLLHLDIGRGLVTFEEKNKPISSPVFGRLVEKEVIREQQIWSVMSESDYWFVVCGNVAITFPNQEAEKESTTVLCKDSSFNPYELPLKIETILSRYINKTTIVEMKEKQGVLWSDDDESFIGGLFASLPVIVCVGLPCVAQKAGCPIFDSSGDIIGMYIGGLLTDTFAIHASTINQHVEEAKTFRKGDDDDNRKKRKK